MGRRERTLGAGGGGKLAAKGQVHGYVSHDSCHKKRCWQHMCTWTSNV